MSKGQPTGRFPALDEQIRKIVKKSGMTTNALAVAAGLPQPVLHRFLKGERENIRLDTADKLCRFFGVKLTTPKWPKGRKE